MHCAPTGYFDVATYIDDIQLAERLNFYADDVKCDGTILFLLVMNKNKDTLYDTYSGILRFRKENPRFFDKDAAFSWTSSGTVKTIKCTADGKSFYVIGNFSKGSQTVTATPPSSGTWTNWFDKTENFTGSSKSMTLKGGEFKLFVNWK